MGANDLSQKFSETAGLLQQVSDLLRVGCYDEADRILQRVMREIDLYRPYMTYLVPERYNVEGGSDGYGGPMPGE